MNPVVVLAVLVVALAGCKQRDSAAISGASTTGPATIAASPEGQPPVVNPSEPVVIPQTDDMNATLDQLSAELRAYVGSTRSTPKDFQDFIARARVQVSPPPAGKDYTIVHGKVVLVSH